MKTRLGLDLLENSHRRLRLWLKDTLVRCQIAELSVEESVKVFIYPLLVELIEFLVVTEYNREDAIELFRLAYDGIVEREAQRAEGKETPKAVFLEPDGLAGDQPFTCKDVEDRLEGKPWPSARRSGKELKNK